MEGIVPLLQFSLLSARVLNILYLIGHPQSGSKMSPAVTGRRKGIILISLSNSHLDVFNDVTSNLLKITTQQQEIKKKLG